LALRFDRSARKELNNSKNSAKENDCQTTKKIDLIFIGLIPNLRISPAAFQIRLKGGPETKFRKDF
jgi:RNA 3'-terminal phosphate cyclase